MLISNYFPLNVFMNRTSFVIANHEVDQCAIFKMQKVIYVTISIITYDSISDALIVSSYLRI
jgi:hypothetical protein